MSTALRLFLPILCLIAVQACDRSGRGTDSAPRSLAGARWTVDSELVSRYGILPGPGKVRRSDSLESKLGVCLRRSFSEGATTSTWVAVCATVLEAPHAQAGTVDLLLFSDSLGTARVVAETTGLESGSFGEPGEVALVRIGADRRAFALSSSFSGMGSIVETLDWYLPDGGRLRGILSSRLYASNEGMSPCDDDSLGCRWEGRRLGIDSSRAQGAYPLQVRDSARRDGRFLESMTTVPYDADSGRYVLPAPLVADFW